MPRSKCASCRQYLKDESVALCKKLWDQKPFQTQKNYYLTYLNNGTLTQQFKINFIIRKFLSVALNRDEKFEIKCLKTLLFPKFLSSKIYK